MKRFVFAILLVLACTPLFSAPRTFVSINGADSGTCPTTAPCRSLSYAYTQTDAGGDIVMIDSGGFGFPFTIAKAINIVAPDGVFGVIQINAAATAGITIAAAASDVVRISSVTFVGTGSGGGDIGIQVGVCKRAEISKVTGRHLGEGIKITADTRVLIDHCFFSDVDTGVRAIGLLAPAATSNLKVWMTGTIISGAALGFKVESGCFFAYGGNQFGDENKIMFATVGYSYLTAANQCAQANITFLYSGQPTDTRNTTVQAACSSE